MERDYEMVINGAARRVTTAPHQTLLDTLRDKLNLTGTKKGCNEGECASCTVLLDGVPVNSCLVLIGDVDGKTVVTIEGLATTDGPHPMQRAFVEFGGVQCGYCTPGMIVSACALLAEHPAPSDEDIKFFLAGNICRCTGYNKILEAVRAGAAAMRRDDAPAIRRAS